VDGIWNTVRRGTKKKKDYKREGGLGYRTSSEKNAVQLAEMLAYPLPDLICRPPFWGGRRKRISKKAGRLARGKQTYQSQ